MRVAVIDHVERIEFVRFPHVPAAGDIVHASEAWQEPGGGGAVAFAACWWICRAAWSVSQATPARSCVQNCRSWRRAGRSAAATSRRRYAPEEP